MKRTRMSALALAVLVGCAGAAAAVTSPVGGTVPDRAHPIVWMDIEI